MVNAEAGHGKVIRPSPRLPFWAQGLGKKKREEKRKSLDRGLMEDRGSFRAGVMRVKLKPGGGGGKKKGR